MAQMAEMSAVAEAAPEPESPVNQSTQPCGDSGRSEWGQTRPQKHHVAGPSQKRLDRPGTASQRCSSLRKRLQCEPTFWSIIASRASCETAPSCQRMLLEFPILYASPLPSVAFVAITLTAGKFSAVRRNVRLTRFNDGRLSSQRTVHAVATVSTGRRSGQEAHRR